MKTIYCINAENEAACSLAHKLSGRKIPGEIIFLTPEEMAALIDEKQFLGLPIRGES